MTGAKVGAGVKRGLDAFHHLRVIVAEQQRTVAAEVIHVAITVDVPLVTARSAFDVQAIRQQIARVVGDA